MARRKRRTAPFYIVLSIFVIFLILVRMQSQIGQEQAEVDRFAVSRIIDGDTMELAGGDKVRLLGIDTPEKGQPYYDDAREFLSRLTLGKSVALDYGTRRRDSYGRLLAFVTIDTVQVNRAIIANGLGYLYLFKDNIGNPKIESMMAAQREAISKERGIWSIGHTPEQEYINTEGSFRFHRPGCRSVAKRREGRFQTFATREEAAIEGLSPCRTCQP